MEALVHGIIQDDEGKTYPPYEITWDGFAFRASSAG